MPCTLHVWPVESSVSYSIVGSISALIYLIVTIYIYCIYIYIPINILWTSCCSNIPDEISHIPECVSPFWHRCHSFKTLNPSLFLGIEPSWTLRFRPSPPSTPSEAPRMSWKYLCREILYIYIYLFIYIHIRQVIVLKSIGTFTHYHLKILKTTTLVGRWFDIHWYSLPKP